MLLCTLEEVLLRAESGVYRLAGYAPCLAATATLTKAGILDESVPGKAGGPPGNAFNLVYNGVVSKVWTRLYTVDGVLAEWIR